MRHKGDYDAPMPTDDDLVALANAVREAAGGEPENMDEEPASETERPMPRRGEPTIRGHLRVVQAEDDQRR